VIGSRNSSGFRTGAVIVLLVLLMFGAGTLGFHIIERWAWFKSFYVTLMTVSTIGAGPENDLSRRGQQFNIVLILLGGVVVAFAIGSFTKAVIEFELGAFFGRRRMEKEIARLKDHFIVCGVGRVGRRVVTEVAARGLAVLIIEKDAEKARWALDRNYPVLIGDASSEEILRQARIDYARALASAVTSDAQNVYIVLTARGMTPKLPIVARASEEDAEAKLLKAGATSVVFPYGYAGIRMARTMTQPNVQRFIDLALSSLDEGNLDLQIEEIRVGDPSKLAGVALGTTEFCHERGVIVLAIRRSSGKLDFNPKRSEKVAAGDCLIVMGDSRTLKKLESLAGV
jgi:voltage-gated potassium channel